MSTVDRRHHSGRTAHPATRGVLSARPRSYGPRSAWISLGGFVVCLGLLALFLNSYFRIHTVRLVGANLPTNTVIDVAGVTGQNVFTVRTDQIIARLESVPSIQVLKVEVAFPSTVTIFAEARTAIAAWQDGKSLVLLDATGRQIGQTISTTLPVATGPRPPSRTQLEAIHYALGVVPRAPGGSLSGFSIDPKLGLQVMGKAGWQATLGDSSAQSMVTRVAALAHILARLPNRHQHLKSADLRSRHPVIRVVSS